jgi:arginase
VIAVLDAPSNLGLRPLNGVEPGVSGLAGALREYGVVSRLGARDAGVCVAPPYSFYMEANRVRIAEYTASLAASIGEVLDAGDFPVVLGGDCSILLGAGVALKRRGRFGLAFVDGHLDFRNLEWAPAVGAVAGEDLAVVTGRAEPSLADIDALGPYFLEQDVVALGEREGDEDEHAALASTAITVRDQAALRSSGQHEPDVPYWIHVDADVLDISAVDSPAPGGLSFGELTALVSELLAGDAVGLQVTVFDPSLDPDGSQGRGLADCLVAAFDTQSSR